MAEDKYLGIEIIPGWVVRQYGCSYMNISTSSGHDASWHEGMTPKGIKFGVGAWDLGDRPNTSLADSKGQPVEDGSNPSVARWARVRFREVAFGSTDYAWAVLERVSDGAVLPVRARYVRWMEVDGEIMNLRREFESTEGKFPIYRSGPGLNDFEYIHSCGQTEYLIAGLARHVVEGKISLEESKEIFEKIFQILYEARMNIVQFSYQTFYSGSDLNLLRAVAEKRISLGELKSPK